MSDSFTISRDQVVDMIVRGVKLPPLSQTGSQVMRLLQTPADRIEVRRLVELIRQDPALSASVLSLANSPYMGTLRKVTSVSQAVALVGLDEIIGILNYQLLRQMLPQVRRTEYFSPDAYWLHSWRCATAARMLGQPKLLVRSLPGELYMAGLLHDIGRLTLALHLPQALEVCTNLARAGEMTLIQAEREIMEIDHAEIGALQLDQWNLPESILAGVRYYIDPGSAPEEHRETAALLQFSVALAHQCETQKSGGPELYPLSDTWLMSNGTGPITRPEVRDPLVAEIVRLLVQRGEHLDAATDGSDKGAAEAEKKPAAVSASSTVPKYAESRPVAPRRGFWSRLAALFSS